jgi:RNA polymerase sigma-70 factor (sigma-E family)
MRALLRSWHCEHYVRTSELGEQRPGKATAVTSPRDAEFADFVATRMTSLRRLAVLLCHDWHRADDLVQAAITRLYLHWPKAKAADNIDAYVRAILVREFVTERGSSWVRRVTLSSQLPEGAAAIGPDAETSLDLRAAIASLPPRQRAVLVLRFYCDLPVDEAAGVLQCAPGTIKSQTAKALGALRTALGPAGDLADGYSPPGRRAMPEQEGLNHA